MNIMSDQFQDIYIYTNKQGVIYELPAFISKQRPPKLQFAIPAFDRDNKIILEQVAREPGMIFHNTIWFKKQNFEKAKALFVNDYGEHIRLLNMELDKALAEMNKLYDQDKVEKEK